MFPTSRFYARKFSTNVIGLGSEPFLGKSFSSGEYYRTYKILMSILFSLVQAVLTATTEDPSRCPPINFHRKTWRERRPFLDISEEGFKWYMSWTVPRFWIWTKTPKSILRSQQSVDDFFSIVLSAKPKLVLKIWSTELGILMASSRYSINLGRKMYIRVRDQISMFTMMSRIMAFYWRRWK